MLNKQYRFPIDHEKAKQEKYRENMEELEYELSPGIQADLKKKLENESHPQIFGIKLTKDFVAIIKNVYTIICNSLKNWKAWPKACSTFLVQHELDTGAQLLSTLEADIKEATDFYEQSISR